MSLIHRLLDRPLLRLGVTLLLNLAIVGTLAARGAAQQRRMDCELRLRGTLTCFYADYNGVYISFLPPQEGLDGSSNARIRHYINYETEPTTIDRNLSRHKRKLILPGMACWWSSQIDEDYDRVVVRLRYLTFLVVAVVLRIMLYRFLRSARANLAEVSDPRPETLA